MAIGITHYYVEGNSRVLRVLADSINNVHKAMELVKKTNEDIRNLFKSQCLLSGDNRNLLVGIGDYAFLESCFNVLIALGIKTKEDYENIFYIKKKRATDEGVRLSCEWADAELIYVDGKTVLKFTERCPGFALARNFDIVANMPLLKNDISKITHYKYDDSSHEVEQTDDEQQKYLTFEQPYIDEICNFDDDE